MGRGRREESKDSRRREDTFSSNHGKRFALI